MSHAKDASKRKRLRKAVPTVGIAGMSLAMAGGASAATAPPTANLPSQHIQLSHEIILGEEEISDVSLGTFFVFDKEDAASELGRDVQLAAGRGCGGRRHRRRRRTRLRRRPGLRRTRRLRRQRLRRQRLRWQRLRPGRLRLLGRLRLRLLPVVGRLRSLLGSSAFPLR